MSLDKLKKMCVEKCMNMARSLYVDGWRSTDREELVNEYDLNDTEANLLCACLEFIDMECYE